MPDAAASRIDAVPRRALVPSQRELADGIAGEGWEFQPLAREERPRVRLRQRWSNFLIAISPRRASEGGPTFPLVVLALLGSVAAWDDVGFNLLVPIVKIDMGFDFTFLTTLQALMFGVAVALSPVAGFLADRVKRVWMVRTGALVGNAAAVASGLAPGPGALVATRIVAGLGPGIENPARLPLAADYFPPQTRIRTFTFLQIFAVLGPALGLAGVYLFVFQMGMSWRVLVTGAGVLSLTVSLLTFFLREPVRGAQDRRALGLSEKEIETADPPAGWAEAWRTLRSIRSLRRLWYATPFLTFAWFGYLSFSFFVLQERLARGELAGPGASLLAGNNGVFIFLAIPPAAGIIALIVAAPRAERFLRHNPGRILVYVGGVLALQAASIVGMVSAPWIVVAFGLVFLSGALVQMIQPAQSALLGVIIPARVRAMGYASIAPWQLLGLAMLPIAGNIADESGPIAASLSMVPVLLVGALVTASAGANVRSDIRAALAASRAHEDALAARKAGAAKMLICRDLEVSYEGTRVLFGVDLDVDEGELLAVMGTNGAGKSTLLRAVAGLQEASNGAVYLDGEDITHKPAHLNAREGIVFLPGGRAIFPSLTVRENLDASTWMDDPDAVDGSDRREEVLDLFPVLRERLDLQAGNLSGGEQQMVALAQSFLMRPRLLMIDELSLGLAPAVVERLLDVVRAINEAGTTVVLVEQSVNVALNIAERAVFMEKGKILFDGPTGELLGRADLVRAAFLGGTSRGAFVTSAARRRSGRAERALTVDGVDLAYGGVEALRDVSFHADAGEVVGIIGPNGAGKTSLFDVVSGVALPQRGSVTIGATDASVLSPDARAGLGLVRSFQDARLFPSLTVRENIAVALERRIGSRSAAAAAVWAPQVRASERRASRRVDYLVELLGLGDYADKFVGELSTGSRRMVDVACVMAAEPKVLLLDEPSSGLAQGEVEVLGPVVQRLARETNAGVIVIEHDLPLVTAMADRLVAMELGRVIAEGPPSVVMEDEAVVRAYLSADASVIQRSGDVRARALASLKGAGTK